MKIETYSGGRIDFELNLSRPLSIFMLYSKIIYISLAPSVARMWLVRTFSWGMTSSKIDKSSFLYHFFVYFFYIPLESNLTTERHAYHIIRNDTE